MYWLHKMSLDHKFSPTQTGLTVFQALEKDIGNIVNQRIHKPFKNHFNFISKLYDVKQNKLD